MTAPWRKDKPVFRIYPLTNSVYAINGTACGHRYRKIAEQLGYYFKGYEDPTKKVGYGLYNELRK